MQPLTGAIADINRLTSELAEVETQIQETESERQLATQAVEESLLELNRITGNPDRLPDDVAAAAKVRAQDSVKAAGQREQDANALLEDLRTRREKIRAALNGVRGAAVSDLLEIQSRLDAAKAAATKIAEVIEQRRAAVQPVSEERLEELNDERGLVLAAIALGEADEKQLAKIEAQIAEAAKAVNAEKAQAGKVTALIEGLQERLVGAEAEVERLREEHRQALMLYLKGEHDQCSGEFAAKTEELFASFGELLGIGRLLGAEETGWRLQVPDLNIAATNSLTLVDDGDFRDAAAASVRKRMTDQGITLNP